MSYDKKFRERALACKDKYSFETAAEIFGVSKTSILNWQNLLKEQGSLDKRPINRKFKKIDPDELRKYVEEHPDAYLKDMALVFNCSSTAIGKALKRLGITRKKRSRAIKNKIQRK